MSESEELRGRELRRYEQQAAKRYMHMIGRSCVDLDGWFRCWRCSLRRLWLGRDEERWRRAKMLREQAKGAPVTRHNVKGDVE